MMRALAAACLGAALPDVVATISSAPKIGTPELSSVAKVRANRLTATFWNSGPKTGTLSEIASLMRRPLGVRTAKMYPTTQLMVRMMTVRILPVSHCDAPSTMLVAVSDPPVINTWPFPPLRIPRPSCPTATVALPLILNVPSRSEPTSKPAPLVMLPPLIFQLDPAAPAPTPIAAHWL